MPDWLLDACSQWSPDERRANIRSQQHDFEQYLDTGSMRLAPELGFHATKMQPVPEISADSTKKEEEIGEPNPVADLVLETLQQAPALRYKGWNRVKDTLSIIPLARRTTELVSLLCAALRGEMIYWRRLQNIGQSILVLESRSSMHIMDVVFPVSVLTGLEVKSYELDPRVPMAYPEIEEDYLALEVILVQLQQLKTVDSNNQANKMGLQQFREVLGRLMGRVRPGKLFAAMAGHLAQIVRDSAPDDNFNFDDPHQVLADCALYL